MKEEGEYNPVYEEEQTNYQRKILPWEKLEVREFINCASTSTKRQ